MDSSVSPKDEIWFLRVCHHNSNVVYGDCSSVLDTALLQDLSFPLPVAVVTLKTGSQGGLVRFVEFLSEFQ
jgi:hypothetical protein